MRSCLRLLILLSFTGMLFGGWRVYHKFYVSLTEVRYNEQTRRLEVSIRVFPDDLDQVLHARSGLETHLASSLEPPEADSLLGDYIHSRFAVVADGNSIQFSYLGKEPESDALWCYLESEPMPAPHILVIRNALLTDQFEDQVNIVQVYAGKWNKGLLLSREMKEGTWHIGK
jgi:hypothetical protein